MKKLIYSVRDKKACTFFPPTLFDNDSVAIRSFGDLVTKDTNSIIHQHPSDFSLCCLGLMDIETGAISPFEVGVRVVADAESFIQE